MHCAPEITCSDAQDIASGENNSNDCDASSLAWMNSGYRCAILTFIPLDPDGRRRIVAVPLQCFDQTNHLGSQLKMDGLRLVSPSLVSYQQKAQRGPTNERNLSVKSFTPRSISWSKLQHQPRNKGLTNEVSRWNALSGNSSCQTSFNGSDSSLVISSGSNASNSSCVYTDVSKVDKSGQKKSRKKAKKKGKRNKKISCDTGPLVLEHVQGSLTSEIGVVRNKDYGNGSLRHATLAVSVLERSGNDNHSEGNSNGTIACTSYTDEVDASEANFIGELPLSNSENGVQTVFPEFSFLCGGEQDSRSEPLSSFSNSCSSVFSETNDSSVLDSMSVGSNGDETTIASSDVKLSNPRSGEIDLSKPTSEIRCFSHGDMLKGDANSHCHAEGTSTCEPRCSGSKLVRKGKQIKRVPKNSTVSHHSSIRSIYVGSEKENNHSIWQKVQKNDTSECNFRLRKVNSSSSQGDIGLIEAPLLNKKRYVSQTVVVSTCENKVHSTLKASTKLKRKMSPVSKQEFSFYSRKDSCATKANTDACTKYNMQHNEVSDMPSQIGGPKRLNGVSRSRDKISCPMIGLKTNRRDSITSVSVLGLEVPPRESELFEHVVDSLCSLNYQTAHHLDQTALLKGQSAESIHSPGGEEATKPDSNFSPVEYSKGDNSSGSILQKWIPIGTKDSVLTRLAHPNSLSLADLKKPAVESCRVENIGKEIASDPGTSVLPAKTSLMCITGGPRDNSDLHSEVDSQIEKCRNQRTYPPKESCINHAPIKCSSHDPKGQKKSADEDYSNKITQAVNDAYRAQLASVAVQMATGCPIAEFERFLCSASPVISLQHNILNCQTCLPDSIVGAPLCRRATPNISLGSLWQWYEKHGTYGLEVRAEDYENSKRLGMDRFAFRAYFVPYLSAIQLFRDCKSHPSDIRDRVLGTDTMEACKLDERSENPSNIGSLPILSLIIPRPHVKDANSLSPRNSICCSETSSGTIRGNSTTQLCDSTTVEDLELLLEYFEVEQPQQRRPLFEMIQELVRGDGSSRCRVYGDPTKLGSVAFNDLHPKSWYSVAWYPIYRIPDGNLRAAFLTYHSLGHLVNRSTTSDSFSVDASVVSPVVGLQSYNAQGECWFQKRQAVLAETTETPNLNPSRILKERLSTLEQTASLMARAVVTKGNLTSVNRQPDYEFFLSRRRW